MVHKVARLRGSPKKKTILLFIPLEILENKTYNLPIKQIRDSLQLVSIYESLWAFCRKSSSHCSSHKKF